MKKTVRWGVLVVALLCLTSDEPLEAAGQGECFCWVAECVGVGIGSVLRWDCEGEQATCRSHWSWSPNTCE